MYLLLYTSMYVCMYVSTSIVWKYTQIFKVQYYLTEFQTHNIYNEMDSCSVRTKILYFIMYSVPGTVYYNI